MSPTGSRTRKNEAVVWNDTLLVKECLAGSEEAWSLLIDKYKALIYSIPVKYGLSPQEAADVFQATCTELLVRLPELREPRALPKWLMQVAHHECYRLKRQSRRVVSRDSDEDLPEPEVPAIAEVAKELGLAVGSIGFTRQRCIERLRRQLEDLGFSDARNP